MGAANMIDWIASLGLHDSWHDTLRDRSADVYTRILTLPLRG